MITALANARRLLRNAAAFAVFGAATLLLAFVAIPLARVLRASRGDRDLEAQRLLHTGARLYMRFLDRIGMVRLSVRNADVLERSRPCLVVANHPTLFDTIVLTSLMPQADAIVNVARSRNPFLRRLVATAGYIPNDNGLRAINECVRRLQSGRSVIVFPEGTRSPEGGLGEFRPGAALIALRSDRDILPAVLSCDPPTLSKGKSWYDVPAGPLRVTVRIGEPLSLGSEAVHAAADRDGDGDAIAPALPQAARRLTAELRESIAKGLEIGNVGSI